MMVQLYKFFSRFVLRFNSDEQFKKYYESLLQEIAAKIKEGDMPLVVGLILGSGLKGENVSSLELTQFLQNYINEDLKLKNKVFIKVINLDD